MEKLIIENIADFERVELELKNFNLLIGPQASGKSVIAKLLHFFKDVTITKIIASFSINDISIETIEKAFTIDFKKRFPDYLIKNNFRAIYIKDDFEFEIRIDNEGKHKWRFPSLTSEMGARVLIEYLEVYAKTISSLFVPADRALFNTYDENIYSMIQWDVHIDPYLVDFGRILKLAKREYKNFMFDEISNSILKGEYFLDKKSEQEYLKLNNKLVKISDISSGQQSLLQILLILNMKYSGLSRYDTPYTETFIIEEPEAHIFPETQYQLIKLFYKHFQDMNKIHSFVLTTHSPYILSSVNNLILSEKLKCKKEKKEYINKDFTAYLVKDGKVQNIIDEESGLIDGDAIDSASEIIGEEFDNLLEELYGED